MKIASTTNRVVTIEPCDDGHLLVERTRYVPQGYSRAKWDEARILLKPDDLAKLAEYKSAQPLSPDEVQRRKVRKGQIGR